jgi:hypothetical protein
MRFVALGLHQAVPAAKMIWRCCDQLKLAGAIEGLLRRFDEVRAARGFLAMGGRIPADRCGPRRAQNDRNARWTLKRGWTKLKPDVCRARPPRSRCRSSAATAISVSTGAKT